MRYNVSAMERKTRIYLDTSIFNFAVDDRTPAEKRLTQKLIEEIKAGKYEAFISDVVLLEINKAGKERRKELLNVIQEVNPEELEVGEEVRLLAEKYIVEGVIPVKHADDALHIAAASVNDVDILVSWNFEHIVKHKTRVAVTGINTLRGYKSPDICTPQEVIENV